ncbi:uncharacterized protein LOC122266116 [Penaeus japonicus]|uniref:uncharacterized protein LOC122266116 n=1 Tax=Penaeus japonicus TaxID=27405 RepID=UPI001C7120EA|nr:uncharacterized protein LOC122266116 [Penaeus japonicus]
MSSATALQFAISLHLANIPADLRGEARKKRRPVACGNVNPNAQSPVLLHAIVALAMAPAPDQCHINMTHVPRLKHSSQVASVFTDSCPQGLAYRNLKLNQSLIKFLKKRVANQTPPWIFSLGGVIFSSWCVNAVASPLLACDDTLGVCVYKGVFVSMWTEDEEEESPPPDITWGQPHSDTAFFDDDIPANVTAVVGHKAELPCRVHNLDTEDVSWIRQRDLHILTVGIFTYTSDERFKVFHPEKSDIWNLEISSVTFRDAGVYECQVSTSPKIFLPVLLGVEVQQAKILGPGEVYIKNGSTISLICTVNTHSENVGVVTWFRNNAELDYDSPRITDFSSRGGVSIEIEKTLSRTTSKLYITRAIKKDSGNYTCAPQFAEAASAIVHVVNGEESAAVQTGNSVTLQSDVRLLGLSMMAFSLLITR